MLDKLKTISPHWWGAVAAATAAGATVLDKHRVLGGLAAGGAMLALAVKQSAPCCAACAGATGDHHDAPTTAAIAVGELTGPTVTPAAPSCAASGCGGLDEMEELFS